jgi:predicted lipoprotein with Yx(FWY)xxD motif
MFKTLRQAPRRSRRTALALLLVAGVAGLLGGAALAKVFTLSVAKHATVGNLLTQKTFTTHATIVVNGRGFAVYTLTGDSAKHPKCTSAMCLQIWPPVTVKSAKALTKAPGVKGKLGIWHRKHFDQATIDGHPLYTFSPDTKRHVAMGEAIKSFGGTWHVRLASGGGHVTAGASTPAPTPGYPSGW